MINIHASYFSIGNPCGWFDRILNGYKKSQTITLNQHDVIISWTRRADNALQNLPGPLIIELQLYFSCVVKKRVLFHHRVGFETARVNRDIEIAFRPVASAVCAPVEFASSYPEGKSLGAGLAGRMIPKRVEIDYRRGHWEGQFNYC